MVLTTPPKRPLLYEAVGEFKKSGHKLQKDPICDRYRSGGRSRRLKALHARRARYKINDGRTPCRFPRPGTDTQKKFEKTLTLVSTSAPHDTPQFYTTVETVSADTLARLKKIHLYHLIAAGERLHGDPLPFCHRHKSIGRHPCTQLFARDDQERWRHELWSQCIIRFR